MKKNIYYVQENIIYECFEKIILKFIFNYYDNYLNIPSPIAFIMSFVNVILVCEFL